MHIKNYKAITNNSHSISFLNTKEHFGDVRSRDKGERKKISTVVSVTSCHKLIIKVILN